MLASIRKARPWLRHGFADGATQDRNYAGHWTIEIVKRSDIAVDFEVIPLPPDP